MSRRLASGEIGGSARVCREPVDAAPPARQQGRPWRRPPRHAPCCSSEPTRRSSAPRRLAAGPLSVEFDRGNLRYIRWGGLEVIRAIAFVIRDTNWGTYAPAITNLSIEEVSEHFVARYQARVNGPDGEFDYRAEIVGGNDGRVAFRVAGGSENGFSTNRTGFVVLHPLKGVVGRAVAVDHASGGTSQERFPELVSPTQPIFDIRGLRHEPVAGVAVTVRMEGDVFEMEDHRNWTDASFKTYVRPLAKGFPYRIEPLQPIEQSVTLSIEGQAEAQPGADGNTSSRSAASPAWFPASACSSSRATSPRQRRSRRG